MPFCPECGAKVEPNHKFCNNCGTTLSQGSQAGPPPPQPATSQQWTPQNVINVAITGLERPKSFGRWDSYCMLADSSSMMIFQVTSKMINQAVMDARDNAKKEGKGFFGQWGAQMGSSTDYAGRYRGRAMEDARRENPGAFTIPLSSVTEVQFTPDGGFREDQAQTYTLRIRTHGGEHKYRVSHIFNSGEFKALKRLLGPRYKSNVMML